MLKFGTTVSYRTPQTHPYPNWISADSFNAWKTAVEKWCYFRELFLYHQYFPIILPQPKKFPDTLPHQKGFWLGKVPSSSFDLLNILFRFSMEFLKWCYSFLIMLFQLVFSNAKQMFVGATHVRKMNPNNNFHLNKIHSLSMLINSV